MKIDNTIKPVPSPKTSETRARASEQSAASAPTGSGTSVQLSGLSAQLHVTAETPTFNSARVAQIKEAIANGSFKINPEAIADRLISSSRELVNSQRRA